MRRSQRILEVDLTERGARARPAHRSAERAEDMVSDELVAMTAERRKIRQYLPKLRGSPFVTNVAACQHDHGRPCGVREQPAQALATDEAGRSRDQRGSL